MNKMEPTKSGLTWYTLDLHVHTPASHDYSGEDTTPTEFLEVAKQQGLDAIAATDHNTGEWVDQLKQAGKKAGVCVFPGVELTVTGGKNGSVHLLAVFDTSATAKTIENLLAKLGLTETEYGESEAVSPKSPEEAVQVISSMGGLALLAHADSSKGVLHDMSGQPRNRVMNRPELTGVEVKDVDRYRKMLDGTDPNYKRRLPVFRSSDNPAPEGNGHDAFGMASRYTRFKMDGLSLEALRQCFSDPEVRIRTDSDLSGTTSRDFPRIGSVSIDQGFLAGRYALHDGLNCVIGGKGVGKSLLIEFVRFALDQPSAIHAIRDDHNSKLAKCLGVGGSVTVSVRTAGGKQLVVKRNYDGGANPIELRDSESGKLIEGDIAELFPITAYSQTEAIEIARSPDAQLQLIDSMLPLGPLQRHLREVRGRLDDSAHGIAEALAAAEEVEELKTDLATVKAQIEELDRLLESEEYHKWRGTFPKTEALDALDSLANELAGILDTSLKDVSRLAVPGLADGLEEDQELKRITKALRSALEGSQQGIADALPVVESAQTAIESVSSDWDGTVSSAKAAYEEWAEEAGGSRPDLVAKLEDLKEEEESLEANLASQKEIADSLKEMLTRREDLLDDLDDTIQAIFEMRQAKYEELTEETDGRLMLTVARGGERSEYLEAVQLLCRGTYAREADIKELVESVSPRKLGKLIFEGDVESLAKTANVDESFAERVVAARDGHDPEEILLLQHDVIPEDVPRIKLRKDDGQYYDLSDLSVGQKCTALLIVALSEADRPVVVDQPEDALDIASIFADVTTPIRGRKHERQFVLTTHNPTVAVAGDADKFLIMKATATAGSVSREGAIDRRDVRKEVILHLEGGPEPYALKAKKYGDSV